MSLQDDLRLSKTPIVLGELGDFLEQYEACTYHRMINDALRDIAREHDTFSFVQSTGLAHKGDLLHFNSTSLRELGQRYADADAWESNSQTLGIH
jgi:hypothetical protein